MIVESYHYCCRRCAELYLRRTHVTPYVSVVVVVVTKPLPHYVYKKKQYAFTYFTKLCGKANFNRKMYLYYIFIVVAFDFFIMSMLLFLYGDRFEFYCIITLYTLGRKLSGNFRILLRDRN